VHVRIALILVTGWAGGVSSIFVMLRLADVNSRLWSWIRRCTLYDLPRSGEKSEKCQE
jgi:hypothetical protein